MVIYNRKLLMGIYILKIFIISEQSIISGQIIQRKLDKKQLLLPQCTIWFVFSFRAVGSDMTQGQLVFP
jgi:hypothetical protein